jgi:L-ribulose-5-phosphate 3-epimerase
MQKIKKNRFSLGLYEKALPSKLDWEKRLSIAHSAGYDFMELSIDESDERLERLKWDKRKIRELRETSEDVEMPILTMCLSGNRRFPIGSSYPEIQKKGVEVLESAILFASIFGIRIVQVAGYDVLSQGEISTIESKEKFYNNLKNSVEYASSLGIMLAVENVGVDFSNSIDKIMYFVNRINSPWLQTYPDVGNLAATGQNVNQQLLLGKDHIAAIHIKDTLDGVFKYVNLGSGIIDFVETFKTLKSISFNGPILFEMWADEEKDNFDIVKLAKKWISDKITKSGY